MVVSNTQVTEREYIPNIWHFKTKTIIITIIFSVYLLIAIILW